MAPQPYESLPASWSLAPKPWSSAWLSRETYVKAWIFASTCLLLYVTYVILAHDIIFLAFSAATSCATHARTASSPNPPPDYFQTTPQIFAGPTATGKPPFLAQTDAVTFQSTPLQTGTPIAGNVQNQSIFEHMGYLSPYFPNPSGFGVDEYILPEGAEIVQVQVR